MKKLHAAKGDCVLHSTSITSTDLYVEAAAGIICSAGMADSWQGLQQAPKALEA